MLTELILNITPLVCSGTISGTVFSDEEPAAGVVVNFSSSDKISFSQNTIVTDSNGQFIVDAKVEPNTPVGTTETILITIDNDRGNILAKAVVKVNCPTIP